MRDAILVVSLFAVVACQSAHESDDARNNSPSDSQGSNQPPGSGGTPGAIACTPGELLCSNNHIWTCTLSGTDASHLEDCSLVGSTTNPATCLTTGCPAGAAACCKQASDTCDYSITSPQALSGNACNPPAVGLNPACGTFNVLLAEQPAPMANVCSTDATEINLVLNRATHTPGTTFSLGTGDSLFYFASISGTTVDCSAWSGSIHWISDVPAWAVDVDVTCTSPSVHLVASFHGQL